MLPGCYRRRLLHGQPLRRTQHPAWRDFIPHRRHELNLVSELISATAPSAELDIGLRAMALG